MDKDEPAGRDSLAHEFVSIIQPLISMNLLRWEDRNLLTRRLASAVEYLQTTEVGEEQIISAKEKLYSFVYDLMMREPPGRSSFQLEGQDISIDHEVFMSSVQRFLPCPPFCK